MLLARDDTASYTREPTKLGKNKKSLSYETKNDKWKLVINKKLELE